MSSVSPSENINPFDDQEDNVEISRSRPIRSRSRPIRSRSIRSRPIRSKRCRRCKNNSRKLKMLYYLLKSHKRISKLLLRHL